MRWQNRVMPALYWSSDTDGILSQQPASPKTVGRIDEQSHNQPQRKPDPRKPRQAQHQRHTRSNSQDRRYRRPRRLEEPWTTRFAFSQNKSSKTYEDEGEQRPDIREVHHFIDAGEHRTYTNGHAGNNRRDVRRAKSRVQFRERLRECASTRPPGTDPGRTAVA